MANSEFVTNGEPLVAGAIYRAPLSAVVPTSALTELPAEFVSLGFISEDGVTNANTRSVEETKDWSGVVVQTQLKEKTDTFKYKMLEILNPEVIKEVFGDGNVSGTLETELVAKANAKELTPHVYVIDMLLAGNYIRRTVIPNGKISEIAEMAYKKTELAGYEVTLTALADASGNTHYEYTAKASKASAVADHINSEVTA